MGWNWTPQARLAQAGQRAATVVTRLDVLHSGGWAHTLTGVISGGVDIDADQPVRANLRATLVDATGSLSKGDVQDLLHPRANPEVAPHLGVRVAVGGQKVDELAPVGVFGLTGRDVDDSDDGLLIQLTGQDRAMGYQGPMATSLGIPGGTPVEEAITALLARRNTVLSVRTMRTGFTCGPLLYAPNIDVWAAAQKLAESVGARLLHDRTGQCVLAYAAPLSDLPTAAYAEGDGLLVKATRSEDSDTIKNVVRAENADGSIVAIARDEDTSSPTYWRGRYGEQVHVLKNPHFGSPDQAMQAAIARLGYELSRSETVTFSCVPDAGRDENEVVTVHRPGIGLNHRGVVTAKLSIPFGAGELMQVKCRQSRMARDGRLLDLRDLELSA